VKREKVDSRQMRQMCYELIKDCIEEKPQDSPEMLKALIERKLRGHYIKFGDRVMPLSYSLAVITYIDVASITRDINAEKNLLERLNLDEQTRVWGIMVLLGMWDLATLRDVGELADPQLTNFSNEMLSYAESDIPMLIIGETGTSKELVAKAIHKLSPWRSEDFSVVDCAALSETITQSELFGHEKGAFTGAAGKRRGILEEIRGTVLLDEIGKAPKSIQNQLLRLIDKKEFRSMGSSEYKTCNARVIATIKPDEIENVYPDLLGRLGYPGDALRVPSLRERLRRVPDGVFLGSLRMVEKQMGLIPGELSISVGARAALLSHHYEYGYRDLEGILRAAVRRLRGKRNVINEGDVNLSKPDKHKDTERIEDIRLIDIFDYANKKKAEIIETRIKEVYASGANPKDVILSEGGSVEHYDKFWKGVKRITGKKLSDIRDSKTSSS
jgi:transcriptional regulator with GAF, ATPase, and Fis domain